MGDNRDEEAVRELDRAWNEAYVRNERTALAEILADDFAGIAWDGQTITKPELMMAAEPAEGTFSEFAIRVFGPTAITKGLVSCSVASWTPGRQWRRGRSHVSGMHGNGELPLHRV